MNKGKHCKAPVKKAKKQMQENIDINSNSNQKLLLATRIVGAVQLLIMLACVVYISFLHLLPIKFLIILAVLVLLVTALHIVLIETKTRKSLLKITSIVLSVVVSVVAIYGGILLGTFHGSIIDLPVDPDVVITVKKDVTNQPFLIYLSGLDTRGAAEIQDKGLSDVNMVVAVNPTTKKILMVNIPRDYYIGLEGNPNKMDKLTHAGNYGISCSMATLEALFDIKFNYYVKVNFKSVVDIVDALGGITVQSDFNFSSYHSFSEKTYSFKKGENNLTGDSALAFARERSAFQNGDRQRGIHQQKVISAVFDKVISPSMLNPSKINGVLKAITSNMKTNLSSNEISSLVQMQLSDMASWDIQTYSVDGTGASRSTYSAGSQLLSVMIPKQETVDEAKLKIEAIVDPSTKMPEQDTNSTKD